MRGALSLMFVDLLGTEVEMATLRELTRDRSVDLLVTWPEMDVVRNRGFMLEQRERWTAFFGSEEWIEIATDGPARRLRAFQQLYQAQLARAGYAHSAFTDSIKNRLRRGLYRPLFASKHERGLQFWQSASATQRAQPPLDFE